MMELTLSDVGVGGAVCALGCLLSLLVAINFTVSAYRKQRHAPPVTSHDVMATLSACVIATLLGWYTYSGVWGRHLLRLGSRYTAATVVRVRRIKGQWDSHIVYVVNGVRYTSSISRGSWPALPVGSRWYVRFATANPVVHEWPNASLAEAEPTVPPAGWSDLPATAAAEAVGYDDPGSPRRATRLDEGEDVAKQ